MKTKLFLLLAAGALAGCAKPGPELGPRHEVTVWIKAKVPFSADYDWDYAAIKQRQGAQEWLYSNSGTGGYYFENHEYTIGNQEAGSIFVATGSFAPSTRRAGSLPSSAYIQLRILVDDEVKADTTINSLMPASSSGRREARLQVTL